ncbi:hypothetical protein BBJ28_00027034 [Nothophytophthora sp. Chile5]|nr:hypothetical protein BBJ28_00027034 [Nothophytophthora sp. Chile5]
MSPLQTQSLPTWSPTPLAHSKLLYNDEDLAFLSEDDTDSESERGSLTLNREDQQLLASFIHLQKQRSRKHGCQISRPSTTTAAPVLIPSQSRRYVPSSNEGWLWDEDEECPCCVQEPSEPRPATNPAETVATPTDGAANDLIFDLEL